jgi:hypothetical protein
VSAIPAYECCCPTEPPIYPAEYYVFSVCPDPCCPLDCADGPDVKWCPSYAVAQGLAVPIILTPATCIKMTLGCCTYVMTAVVANPGGVCPTGGGVWNQGTYAGTRTIDPEEEGCCDPVLIDPPDTCVVNLVYPETPLLSWPCWAYVFEPYDLADQWGIVPSKPVTVRSNLTYCYATFGANWDQRCENCPPIDHYQSTVKASQEIGYCIPEDVPASCLGQRTYSQTVTLDCAECFPCSPCCGIDNCNPPTDPPTTCDDPKATYSVRTCYAVNPCLDENDDFTWFEQDVLTVTYDFCATAIDPNDPTALAQLDALFTGGGVVVPWYFAGSALQDPNTGIRISLCPGAGFGDPSVFVYSGNAKHIADAINDLSVNTPFLSAQADEVWGGCFWFGIRQTCDSCPEGPPGQRPAYGPGGQDADELVFDRCEIVSATKFKAIFKGRSKRFYVCAAQTLISAYSVAGNCVGSSTDVINLAISATGDDEEGYELQCLSPAEYACGARYEMRQVEQEYCDTTICTAGNPTLTVPKCDAVTGYPLLDVVVEGVTVLEGWQSLCGGGLGGLPSISQINCRSYPFVYEVLGCEDPFYAGECIDVFQQADRYCETLATPIQVL